MTFYFLPKVVFTKTLNFLNWEVLTLKFKNTAALWFNPFHATALFQYPLKTFLDGTEGDQWRDMGQETKKFFSNHAELWLTILYW